MASLLRGLLSLCQHGHSGTESPSVLDSEQHLRVIRESFFWGGKKRPQPAYVFRSPRMLQKDFGGANRRVGEPTRLVCQAVTCSQHEARFLATSRYTHHLLPSHRAQFINHICTQGDCSVRPPCSEGRDRDGTILPHWNSVRCSSKIAWGWQPP